MPIDSSVKKLVIDYCDRDLPKREFFDSYFAFITDNDLIARLGLEFYAARFSHKLSESLGLTGDRRYPHVKFQIVQYASIYEAVIVYLLQDLFSDHPAMNEVIYHEAYKKAGTLPKGMRLADEKGNEIHLCVKRKEKTSFISIKFRDKLDIAVNIGFVSPALADEIFEFYNLRNAVHIEKAVKDEVKYELDQSRLAYLRLKPFAEGIRTFLSAQARAKDPHE